MEQYSKGELREMQLKDVDLSPVIGWLETSQDPSQAELQLQSPATRHYWRFRDWLHLKNGVLYYWWDFSSGQCPLMVTPKSLRKELICLFHNAQTAGHLGRDKTLEQLRRRFWWYGMSVDVRLHIATCGACCRNKPVRKTPKAPLENYQAGHPGDRIHMDLLGPFCESASGKRYVLMVIDQFTRWLEIIPLVTQDAQSVTQAFFEQYVVRFGVPVMIHTDQGRNFEGDLFQAFCALLEVVKTRTTPYRPSSNGQVERYNQLVLNFLRCFLGRKQQEWDTFLPVLGMCIRSTVNRHTGFTPNFLRLGQEVNMPADIMFGLPKDEHLHQLPSEYLLQLREKMSSTYAEVRANLQEAQQQQKAYYDRRARLQTFEEGDVVYRRNTARKPGQSRKLAPLYEGPFLVLRALTNSLYLVADQKRMQTWHHDKLRMCHESPLPTWLLRQRNLLMHGEHPFLKDLDSRSESSKVGAGTGCTVMVAPRTNDEGVMDSGCTVMVTPRTNDEGVMDSGCTVMVAPADNEGPSDSGELQGEAVSWCTVMVAPGSASLEELDPDLGVTLPYREDECVEESADEEESLHDLDLAQLFKAPRVSRTGCHIRTPRHLEDFV